MMKNDVIVLYKIGTSLTEHKKYKHSGEKS